MLVMQTSGKHAERNCIAIALSYYAGLLVKEIASLLISDVNSEDGKIKQFIFLSADKSKGHSRIIVINKYLASQLKQFAPSIDITKRDKPLIAP